uniref:Uncharacterized protein n=2 Tax=Ditylum brightwellii TaxID=49249 RepID=A0A6U3U521_9STRA
MRLHIRSPHQRSCVPSNNFKGLFVGSGSDGLGQPCFADAIIDLTGKVAKAITVLYLGTATYDRPENRLKQTSLLSERGCRIISLDVTSKSPSIIQMINVIEDADVILASGGNTLFACDRWKRLGLDKLLRDAMLRGTVLTGGSAGAICWFDGGHSDSMDPDSYKTAMLSGEKDVVGDESSAMPENEDDAKTWEYIRVDSLSFLPGLVCPHHDITQSNGIPRSRDFDEMMLRHSSETGIGIDHWAGLEINGDRYRVVSAKGKEGSVMSKTKAFSPDRKGIPGVWIKKVVNGQVHSTLCPESGFVDDLLSFPATITKDERMYLCRKENPDDGPMPQYY